MKDFDMTPINNLMEQNLIRLNGIQAKSFDRTVFMNLKTEETVKRLISEAFYAIPSDHWWRASEADELIKAAINLGFTELADELTLFND